MNQSRQEELANSITHGVGMVLSAAGLVVLVVMASFKGNRWHMISFSIYGASLLMLYTASTLYHSFQSSRVKHVLRIIDHASIYLLIAGTYTPFLLINLRGGWGWSLFGTVWGLSAIGIIFQAFFVNRFKAFATLVYVLMGWLVIIAFKPLVMNVPVGGILMMAAGGLFYTFGVVFYVMKNMRYHHAVWHLMVLAGSVCHYFAIMFYVLPVG
ncbi:MAG: hemolysin III family protein [Lentisphaerota bacterium]